jgi:16S rRNA (adenine1518-N6/adenine1519-N6)-dimethyltransferase
VPGRRFGQHFLIRQAILERIAEAVSAEGEALVVEIGPGKGALTASLLRRARRVIAIEVDPLMTTRLRERFYNDPRLELVESDVLQVDLTQWGPTVIAGNLPYYITSPIIERILSMKGMLRRAVVLVQKEVADRLTASPGSRDYGYLSVATQLLASTKTLFRVPPSAFQPPPQVDSAVVRLDPRAPGERFGIEDPEPFLKFASHAFRQKRKTLRNNLIAAYPRGSVEELPEAGLRAEQISIERLAGIYRTLRDSS